MKKILCTVLVVCMALTLAAPGAFAAPATEFTDVSEGYWAEGDIARFTDYGVIQGHGDGTFGPDDPITREQFAVIINRVALYQLGSAIPFEDVPATNSFSYDAIVKLYTAGIMRGDGEYFRPKDPISRQEAFVTIARAFGIAADTTGTVPFTDAANVASWAYGQILAMSNLGYISGYPDGSFKPQASIKRAEAVTILGKIIEDLYNEPKTIWADTEGNAVINSAGVTIRSSDIEGNLYVMPGVGDGDVILDDVKIGGTLVAYGGGPNSIIIRNGSVVTKIETAKQGGTAVHIDLSNNGGDGEDIEIIVTDGTDAVITGNVGKVTLTDDGSSLTIMEGSKVGNVNIEGAHAMVVIDEDVIVDEIAIGEAADNTSIVVVDGAEVKEIAIEAPDAIISVGGTVDKILVAGNGADIFGDGDVKEVEITEDVTEVIVIDTEGTEVENNSEVPVKDSDGVTVVEPETTDTTPKEETGGGGGGVTVVSPRATSVTAAPTIAGAWDGIGTALDGVFTGDGNAIVPSTGAGAIVPSTNTYSFESLVNGAVHMFFMIPYTGDYAPEKGNVKLFIDFDGNSQVETWEQAPDVPERMYIDTANKVIYCFYGINVAKKIGDSTWIDNGTLGETLPVKAQIGSTTAVTGSLNLTGLSIGTGISTDLEMDLSGNFTANTIAGLNLALANSGATSTAPKTITIPSSANITLNETTTTVPQYVTLDVDGTLEVPSSKTLTVTGTLEVDGTLTVAGNLVLGEDAGVSVNASTGKVILGATAAVNMSAVEATTAQGYTGFTLPTPDATWDGISARFNTVSAVVTDAYQMFIRLVNTVYGGGADSNYTSGATTDLPLYIKPGAKVTLHNDFLKMFNPTDQTDNTIEIKFVNTEGVNNTTYNTPTGIDGVAFGTPGAEINMQHATIGQPTPIVPQ
ncbi:MAG: S-layer homology domain-containing protein [Oscillospiraceae bacterium]|jgi:hypothetical protein|nr:S-layer homology domain-containing protein [Oscillospiraceae bacterium]